MLYSSSPFSPSGSLLINNPVIIDLDQSEEFFDNLWCDNDLKIQQVLAMLSYDDFGKTFVF